MAQNAFSMAYCISCNSYVDENHQPHIFNKGHYQKDNNMEEQMEQVWRSKDGKVTGSKEEVEAYLKSKNPLAGMRFPYQRSSFSPALIRHNGEYAEDKEVEAIAALANLAPLIQEAKKISEERADPITQWDYNDTQRSLRNLFLAYEEVLKQVPQ